MRYRVQSPFYCLNFTYISKDTLYVLKTKLIQVSMLRLRKFTCKTSNLSYPYINIYAMAVVLQKYYYYRLFF